MNGRYLIVQRIAAALVTALLLSGCGPEEAQMDREARPASEAPAARELPATAPGQDDTVMNGDLDRPSGASGSATSGAEPSSSQQPSPPPSQTGSASGTNASPSAGSASEGGGSGEAQASSREPSPESILRATSRAYEGLRSFRATFEQTLENTLLGRTTRSEGTLYQRQPDRFLLEFSDPAGDRIVSDGRYFWMYFPSVDAKQVIRSSRGAQGLDLRSQFIGDPMQRFETTYHGTETVRGREAHVMTLVPREAMGYQRLKVWIDADDHLVRRFELTENNGNVRHFVLSDFERNPSLSDDLFEFTPPAGAQVVER